jgi:hypothetical protein
MHASIRGSRGFSSGRRNGVAAVPIGPAVHRARSQPRRDCRTKRRRGGLRGAAETQLPRASSQLVPIASRAGRCRRTSPWVGDFELTAASTMGARALALGGGKRWLTLPANAKPRVTICTADEELAVVRAAPPDYSLSALTDAKRRNMRTAFGSPAATARVRPRQPLSGRLQP